MLKVSVKTRTLDLVIENENGDEVKYKLRQMTGAEADEYRSVKASKIELDKNGELVRVLDYSGQYVDLLTRTLVTADGKAVPVTTINGWPDEALKELFKASAKLNRLSDTEDEELDPKKS
jgi:hypothetical protein